MSTVVQLQLGMIGTGYVGLVSGVCFAELGHKVICLDNNQEKIAALEAVKIPIYEPLLEDLVRKNLQNGRLAFETDLQKTLRHSQAIFIAVGTPTAPEDGRADLSNLEAVARDIAPFLDIDSYKVIVIKSTVPVGTCRRIVALIREINPQAAFDVVSNPEFLREGSAVHDFMHPDRIVMGAETPVAKAKMDAVYQPFLLQKIPVFYMDFESSELIKYAANCFLATKIAFINEIANLCERTGASIEKVSEGLGFDKRIGFEHLKPGPGFGGSCFPKDTLALAHSARVLDMPLSIVESVIKANEVRKLQMVQKIIETCDGSVQNKTLAILGLAFKANTNDIRESSALTIIRGLQEAGANIVAYDPAAMENARQVLSKLTWAQSAKEAIKGVAAAVIVTEWPEFSDINFQDMGSSPIVIDLRNIYDPQQMSAKGIRYASVGRKTVCINLAQAFRKSEKSPQPANQNLVSSEKT